MATATWSTQLVNGCIVTFQYDDVTMKFQRYYGTNNATQILRVYVLTPIERSDTVLPSQSVDQSIPPGQQWTLEWIEVPGKNPMIGGMTWRCSYGI